MLENPNQAIKFLKEKNLDPLTTPRGKEILNTITGFTRGDGYTYLLTRFYVNEKMPITDIKKLYEYLKTNKEQVNKLPKPVVTYQTYRELRADMDNLESMRILKKLYNELPAQLKQQQAQLSVVEQQNLKELAGKFNKLTADQQNFFIRKVSGYKDIKIFIENLKNYIYSIENGEDFNSITAKINATDKAHIIYSNPDQNIIIAHINSFDASKALGCTSSWCITREAQRWREYKKGGNKYFFIWDFNYPAEDNRYLIGTAYNNKRPELSKTHYKDNGTAKLDTEIKAKKLNYDIFNTYIEKYDAEQRSQLSQTSGLVVAMQNFDKDVEPLIEIIKSSQFIQEFGSPDNVEANSDEIELGMKEEDLKGALELGDDFDYIERVSFGNDSRDWETDELNYIHARLTDDNMALLVDVAKKLGLKKEVYDKFDSEEGAIKNFLEKYELDDINQTFLSELSQAEETAEENAANEMIAKVPFNLNDAKFNVKDMLTYMSENEIVADNFDELIEKIKENLPDFSYSDLDEARYENADYDTLNEEIKKKLTKIISDIVNNEDNPNHLQAVVIADVNEVLQKLKFKLTDDKIYLGFKAMQDKTIKIYDAAYDENNERIVLTVLFEYNPKYYKKIKKPLPQNKNFKLPLNKLQDYINQYQIPYEIDEAKLRKIIFQELENLYEII